MSTAPTPTPTEIQINIKGPSELKLQITISNDKTVLDLKQAIAERSDVEADRQRLIYSGRVLKDEDPLSHYKIQSSHTIHMVKGVSRSNPSTSATSQPLPSMSAGQNPTDPLTVLNGPMGHGLMAGFNPFDGLGVNPTDPNMMQSMLDSPEVLQQMSTMMSNPAMIDQIIALNPQLAAMGPQLRQMFQSEQFRQLVSNPQALRSMLQMSSLMRQSGLGPGAGGFGAGGFGGFGGGGPQQGNPNNLFDQAAAQQQHQTPFGGGLFGGIPPPTPPSTAPATGTPSATTTNPTGTTGTAGQGAQSPFGLVDPNFINQLMGAPGGMFGGGGFGSPIPPADTRPPEERFQVQLQQLQDMGFTNASQNIRALLATGGNVHSAIEYILGGGGL